jgi:SlyX protein
MNEQLYELREQLVELQTQLAFQEDALQSLDRVVTTQQQQLDKLLRTNARLEQQVSELSSWAGEQRGDVPLQLKG